MYGIVFFHYFFPKDHYVFSYTSWGDHYGLALLPRAGGGWFIQISFLQNCASSAVNGIHIIQLSICVVSFGVLVCRLQTYCYLQIVQILHSGTEVGPLLWKSVLETLYTNSVVWFSVFLHPACIVALCAIRMLSC